MCNPRTSSQEFSKTNNHSVPQTYSYMNGQSVTRRKRHLTNTITIVSIPTIKCWYHLHKLFASITSVLNQSSLIKRDYKSLKTATHHVILGLPHHHFYLSIFGHYIVTQSMTNHFLRTSFFYPMCYPHHLSNAFLILSNFTSI